MHDEKELKWYDRMKLARPKHFDHGLTDSVDNPLADQLPKVICTNWRSQGNFLLADTKHGVWSQYLGPKYICLGTDEHNLPILKKVLK